MKEMRQRARLLLSSTLLMLAAPLPAGCQRAADPDASRPMSARGFPRAERPVAKIVANSFSTEAERDDHREAAIVMDLARIVPNMTVADIGAGEGYYTVRLAARVGKRGRVVAQDIDRTALKRLGARVERERLDNVAIQPGDPDDPRLPEGSFDRVLLIHMYHEVTEPYAFLWRLRPSLVPHGRVVVVDLDRPTARHGTPPAQLFCEFAAVGFRLVTFTRKPEIAGYYAEFEASGDRPAPAAIRPCAGGTGQPNSASAR